MYVNLKRVLHVVLLIKPIKSYLYKKAIFLFKPTVSNLPQLIALFESKAS
jgi:hypothetical protein